MMRRRRLVRAPQGTMHPPPTRDQHALLPAFQRPERRGAPLEALELAE